MARVAATLSTFAVLAQAAEPLLRGSTLSESRRLDQQQGEQGGNSGSTGFFYGNCFSGLNLLGGERNFHGRNMDGFAQHNSDAQACRRHCERTDGCVGFTLYAAVCHLKDVRSGEPWPEAGAVSGYCGEVRDCTEKPGKNNDCEGGEGDDSCNLFQVAGSDGQKPLNAQDCLDACASYSECRSCTWTLDQCWLKRTRGGSTRDDPTATRRECRKRQ